MRFAKHTLQFLSVCVGVPVGGYYTMLSLFNYMDQGTTSFIEEQITRAKIRETMIQKASGGVYPTYHPLTDAMLKRMLFTPVAEKELERRVNQEIFWKAYHAR